MQSLVCETAVWSQHDHAATIAVAAGTAGTIREMPGILQRVQHNIASSAEYAMKSTTAILNNFCIVKQR
jgi:hypothetical protein